MTTANQSVVLGNLRSQLVRIATEHDRKESTKRFHNRYALAQYFMAIDRVISDLGLNPSMLTRDAILEQFTGQLCDRMLRGLGFAVQSRDEKRGILEI